MISPHPHQRHWLAGSAREILGRYPLKEITNGCAFLGETDREREGASVRSDVHVGQEAAQP